MSARPDCPALAKATRVVRQVEGGTVRWVVRAGATGKYLRVGEAEQLLLGLMDGSRTLEEIRKAYVARARESLDIQDLAGFVARMRQMHVVEETEEQKNLLLVEKARQRRKERLFAGSFGSILFLRVKLFDPDRFLSWLEPWFRWIFTKRFVVFASCMAAVAMGILVARRDEVLDRLKDAMLITAGAHVNPLLVWATTLSIVACHETGHGVACKHWGGEVHDAGFLLMFFQPCFYCNVNDAWTFESRAAKLWVTAAGGVVEIILGSFCVILWSLTEDGTAVHGVAYLVFMISLSFSLFMNMNPLMRFDGYYLFADLVRVENLRERAFAQVGWLLRAKVFRLQAPRVASGGREAWVLSAYGICAMLYMGGMIAALLGLLWGAAFGEGRGPGPLMLLFFGWICWMMLQRPLRAVGGIVSETVKPRMERMGPRAFWGRCGAGAAGLLVISMFVPWTRVSSAAGTAEPGRIRDVRSPLEGVVARVMVEEGTRVAEGDALLRVDAPEEEARARMERERAQRLRRDAQGRIAAGDAAAAGALEKQAAAAEVAAADSEARLAQRTVSSPGEGIVLTRRIGEAGGLPVHRETGLMKVGDCSRVRFRCIMDARAVAPVREGMEATVRLLPFPGSPLPGKVVAVSRQPLDEKDTRLKEVTGPHWEVVVEADAGGLAVLPGMTGVASVVIERTTLAASLARGLRETVRSDLLR